VVKKPVRVLHFADAHLDRPFVGLSRDSAARRRADLRAAFERCVEAARAHDADLVTIGGDLWEDENVSRDTRASVAHLLEQVGAPVLIVCGNHDPLLPGGHYERTKWPDNVHIFEHDEPSEYRLDGVSVWGVSWTGGQLWAGFLDRFRVPDDGRVHVLLLHGTAVPSGGPAGGEVDGYCPFSPQRVRDSGFALCLAGHEHGAVEGTGLVYPGSPEPLGWAETGRHCYALVDVEAGQTSVGLVDVNRRRVEHRAVDCGGAGSSAEVAGRLRAALADPDPENILLRAELTGEVQPEASIDTAELAVQLSRGYAALTLIDSTSPVYDLDALATQQTARGHFVRRLGERIAVAQDEDERSTLELARLAGLRALDGREDVL
jgi:DNA repair protein SbcD/Mre11